MAAASSGPEDNLLTPRQGGAVQLASMSHRRSRWATQQAGTRQ